MPPGRDPLKAMGRLARIIAVLDDAGVVGATTERLLQVAEYGGEAAPKDQLSLDLRNLRHQGWQIENVGGRGEVGRYRMVSGDSRLRLKLSPEQTAALQRAVILSERGDLAKWLGVEQSSLPAGMGSQVLSTKDSDALSLSLQAVQVRSRMRFTYKGSSRVFHPGAVRLKNYRWYLSGVEEDSEVLKHFIVGDMSKVALDPPGTARRVAVDRLALHPLRWLIDEPTEVTVRTTPDYVPDVIRWLMEPTARSQHGDEVDLRYTVTNRQAFRSRIYVLGPRVRIADGGVVRDEMIAELRAMVGR